MELTFSPTSPFVRKVLIIAHELGIADKIKLVPTNPRADTERLVPLNPLSKVPVMITGKGEAIYDSPVICEYLDTEFGKNRFIPVGDRRWHILTVAALGMAFWMLPFWCVTNGSAWPKTNQPDGRIGR